MDNYIIGKVIKVHSDFYYVKVGKIIYECKLREILKKEKINVYTGDNVVLEEINEKSLQAAITSVTDRVNFIPRPAVANIDQAIIVASFAEPELDFIQLNRYLAQAMIYNIPAIICINKSDLERSKSIEESVRKIYEPLGYAVVFTCAINGNGIDELKNLLKNKTSVFCGMSGVGKSSLLNCIHPDLNLRTKKVSSKTRKGIHTTRHVELLEIAMSATETGSVFDTPGFSYLKFDTIMPQNVQDLFPEIKKMSEKCYFSDCLHVEEEGCYILSHSDEVDVSRYESYRAFLKEAFEYKEKSSQESQKEEDAYKTIDASKKTKTKLVKLGAKVREKSRRVQKQKMQTIRSLDEDFYENLDSE